MQDYDNGFCSICGEDFSEYVMRCTVGCDFDLCGKCATLEDTVLELLALRVRRPALTPQMRFGRLLVRQRPSTRYGRDFRISCEVLLRVEKQTVSLSC